MTIWICLCPDLIIDYERLFEIFKNNEDFAIFNYEHGSAMQPYGRICDMRRTFVDQYLVPWIDKETGVYFTIFPLDGCEDSIEAFRARMQPYKDQWQFMFTLRGCGPKLDWHRPLKVNMRKIAKRFVYSRKKLNDLIESHISQCLKYDWISSTHVYNVSYLGSRVLRAVWPKEDFESYLLVPFEDRRFFIPQGYDRVLRNIFGDYMQLPPEDKKCPVITIISSFGVNFAYEIN